MNLTFKSDDLGYKTIIEQYIANVNPCLHANAESILEAVMKEIIASQNVRYGPAPSIESQFFIREIIRKAINLGKPIPILIPSGPKKTETNQSIDMAEFSALRIMNNLGDRIRNHYKQGVNMVVRLEDLTGYQLEPDYAKDIDAYCFDFQKLVNILQLKQILPRLESKMPGADKFDELVQQFAPYFYTYLHETNSMLDSQKETLHWYRQLKEFGWLGIINKEQRDMYQAKYNKLYPSNTFEENQMLMAKYFASSLARKNLDMKGNYHDWNDTGYIEMSFLPPVDGYTHQSRIFYRNVELSSSKRHIAFWRAKGYLKISNDNSVRTSLITWLEASQMEFHEAHIEISNGTDTVNVKSDYILE
jgi:hypothetical protein